MKITKAHKIQLNPTEEQSAYFWRAWGVAKKAQHMALAEFNRIMDWNRANPDNKESYSTYTIRDRILKNKPDYFNGSKGVMAHIYQRPFQDVYNGFKMFFEKNKKGLIPKANKPRKDGRPNGWPKFKNRFATPSFYIANIINFDDSGYNFWFDKKRCGLINMCEKLRFDGKILAGRISYKHGRWWLSVQVEMEVEDRIHNTNGVGVDLGIKYLAVTSDDNKEPYQNPKPFILAQKKLRRLKRKLDRQRRANNEDNYNNEDDTVKKGATNWIKSNNMIKTEKKIRNLNFKVMNIRQDVSHKMTSELTDEYGIIALEHLNVKGMMKNGNLSKHIGDAAFYEKRRQFEYKSEHKGGRVLFVNRWFPSSKLCNNCDYKNVDLTLNDRVWICPNCNSENERDKNAAKNILKEALKNE